MNKVSFLGLTKISKFAARLIVVICAAILLAFPIVAFWAFDEKGLLAIVPIIAGGLLAYVHGELIKAK